MKKKYLPLYQRWASQDKLDHDGGLCLEFYTLGMYDEMEELKFIFSPPAEIYDNIDHSHWGSGSNDYRLTGLFTPMRQNIILLMAAMAGEL